MYTYRVYNNLFWIFLIQMEYRLQNMYNHMVGWTASVVSPFFSLLPGPSCIRLSKKIVDKNTLFINNFPLVPGFVFLRSPSY